MTNNYEYKQILVIRKDLKMRIGKIASQAAHASLAATIHNLDREEVKNWLAGRFVKITCYVNSEEELFYIYNEAKKLGLIVEMITDSGFTEFHNIPTNTCIAVGPAKISDIDPITKGLPLY